MKRWVRIVMLVAAMALAIGPAAPVQGAPHAAKPAPGVERIPAPPRTVSAESVVTLGVEPNNDIDEANQVLNNIYACNVHEVSDPRDVFSYYAHAGDVLEFAVDYSAVSEEDIDIWLYPPGSTTVDGDDPVAWSVLFPEEWDYIRYTVPTGETGWHYLEVWAWGTNGGTLPYTLTVTENGGAPTYSGAERWAGDDRYETAAEIALQTFDPNDTYSAVIANGTGFADALSGSGLAGAVDGPVLLTPRDSLHWATDTALHALNISEVYIIGGTGAVSNAVQTEIAAIVGAGNVHRIAGANRYDTALAVANRMGDADMYMGPPNEAFVVYGGNYPDALAAAPFAFTDNRPILLTPKESLYPGVATFLGNTSPDAYVIGGEGAVSAAAYTQVDAAAASAQRIAGANRYQTAAAVAHDLGTDPSFSNDFGMVGIATGWNFPDALAGGAAMGHNNGVLLLTERDTFNGNAYSVMNTDMIHGCDVAVFGGEGAVGFNTWMDIWDFLQNDL